MKLLTREQFLNPTELKTKEVPTPELGEDTGVLIRELGSDGRIVLLREFGETVNLEGPEALELRAKMLRLSLIDESGELMCPNAEDLDLILRKDMDLLIRLGDEALALSGIGGDDEDEDTAKNFEGED